MSELPAKHLEVVCTHILKLNKAKCVHTKPQKKGPRPNPVPGRACPSLKLKLSDQSDPETSRGHLGAMQL